MIENCGGSRREVVFGPGRRGGGRGTTMPGGKGIAAIWGVALHPRLGRSLGTGPLRGRGAPNFSNTPYWVRGGRAGARIVGEVGIDL